MNLTFHRWPGGSGEIRGQQVGDYLGMPVGMMPGSKANGGINIYVKGQPPEDYPRGRTYLDLMDAPERIRWTLLHPDIGLIAISKTAKEWMRGKLGRDDIHLIPEHHCNYGREQRTRDRVENIGVSGNRSAFWGITPAIVKRFADMGLRFTYRAEEETWRKFADQRKAGWDMSWMQVAPLTRQTVIEYYRTLDIQVVWRDNRSYGKPLRNPLKLANAGSFGIPTVAYAEPSYVGEFTGAVVFCQTLEEMFAAVKRLKDDPIYYRDMAQAGRERAEAYHIEHISKLYLQLPGVAA